MRAPSASSTGFARNWRSRCDAGSDATQEPHQESVCFDRHLRAGAASGLHARTAAGPSLALGRPSPARSQGRSPAHGASGIPPPRFPPPPRIAEPKRPSPTPRAFSKRFPTAPSSVANGSSTATGSLTPRTSRSMPRSLRCGSCCFRLDEIMKGRRVSPAAFPFVWSLSLTRGGA